MNDQDYPNVRPIAEVVDEMLSIAARCEEMTPDTMIAGEMAGHALTLVLELRVPRMPDTPEELAEMMADAGEGPTYSSEETFERLRRHSDVFAQFLDRFRAMVADGRIEDAALCLGPNPPEGAPKWQGAPASIATAESRGIFTVTIARAGRMEECTAADRGLATLGAVLRCHARWSDIRRR